MKLLAFMMTVFCCWFSYGIVKCDIDRIEAAAEAVEQGMHRHFEPGSKSEGGFVDVSKKTDSKGPLKTSQVPQNAIGVGGEELKRRRRRFNTLRNEGMAFYRPTKQHLFFISSGSSNGEDEIHHQVQPLKTNLSTVDKSDLLTVRSVEDEDEAAEALSSQEELEVGGISNIPGLSSSEEEKLLEYSSQTAFVTTQATEQTTSTTATTAADDQLLFDENEQEEESLQIDLGTEEEYEVGEDESKDKPWRHNPRLEIVSKLLTIVESQATQGPECTPGTDLNLGEKVVNRYAQERFHDAARIAVNMANWFTRMWKYAPEVIGKSEYLIHATLYFGTELTDDIFAFGNCYDAREYKNYFLFCPYAYRLPEGPILAKDLAIEYKYLSNTSEWFYIARKRAESVIQQGRSLKIGYHTYTYNSTAHTERTKDKILTVKYEDGAWTKPYYDCGGGNIWMMTYTVPFFGFENGQYFFKGTSGIDIDLRRVDINQCPSQVGAGTLNIFGGTDKCKKETTNCEPITGLGFRRGSYKCVCKTGYYFPNITADNRFFNGTDLEEEYSKILTGQESSYEEPSAFQCLKCAEGCESCEDSSPCIVTLNWVLRTILLILQCVIIGCLPIVVLFTYKYKDIKVVRAASPVLLRIIILGAFFIYSTTIILYPTPNIVTCTMRIWLREIGFALAYGALMLKTWRISVIFRVKSAKAVKITDMDLIKRLGLIVGVFVLFLLIRTLVSPPVVIVGRTSDHLKAFLCQSDWWDHSFTILEFLFLLWGIRLCIMVRKAPSEFNESRFISMTIYNEFLLSIFLNVSVFFLQHPANPDLLFIIFFCHSQLTISILLCLIFASKFYLVMKGHGKQEENSMTSKSGPGKFVTSKVRVAHNSVSQVSNMPGATPAGAPAQPTTTNNSAGLSIDASKACIAVSDKDLQMELDRIFLTLQNSANPALAAKIADIKEALNNTQTATKAQVQVVTNGQVVNSSTALLPVSVAHPPLNSPPKPSTNNTTDTLPHHDSPVIVHQCAERQARVSFDLTGRTSGDDEEFIAAAAAAPPPPSSDSKSPTGEVENQEEIQILLNNHHNSESGSTCSRCCCSSYVCSVCSPRGSIDNIHCTGKGNGLRHSDGGSSANSIELTSPRQLMNPQEDEIENETLEMKSQLTQTESNHLLHRNSKTELNETSLKTKAESKAQKTHRILINLDDKNRFTDEVTV